MNRNRVFMILLYACGVILYFFCNLQRSGVPSSLFNELQMDFGFSAGQVAGLGTAFIYVYAFHQLVAGYFADRYGGVRTMVFGTFFFCAGSVLFPLTHSLWTAYAARALVGFGASFIYLSMVKFSSRLFPSILPQMVGVLLLCGYMGNIVANAPLAYLAGQFTWRTVLLTAGVLATVFFVFFLLLKSRVKLDRPGTEPFNLKPFKEFFARRHNCWICLFNFANFPLYFIVQSILGKKFLQDYCAMSGSQAAMAMSGMAVLAACSGMLTALLTRCIGNRRRIFFRAASVYSVIAMLFLMAAIQREWHSPYLAIPLLLFGLASNFAPVCVALLCETNPEDRGGIAVSISNFSSYLGVSVFGSLAGYLMDLVPPVKMGNALVYGRGSYLAVFGVFLFMTVITLISSFRLRETFGKNIASEVR